MDGLTTGRIVHYVMPNGTHRPAIITNVFNDRGLINVNVFTDYTNDVGYTDAERQKLRDFNIKSEEVAHGHIWRTSISFSEDPIPGSWHWIEKA